MESDTLETEIETQAYKYIQQLNISEQNAVQEQDIKLFIEQNNIKLYNHSFFKPLKFLGRGSFADVHLVTYENQDIQFAAKQLILTKNEFKQIQGEITILNKLDSEYTVKLEGISYKIRQNGILEFWILLEIMQMDLSDYIYKQHDFPINDYDKLLISKQISQGLQKMHSLNFCHRDIKPSNILVKYDNQKNQVITKLSDFGLSRQIDKTQQGTCSRTPLYAPPELLIEEKFSTQSDIWSFGLVLYELFFQQKPYTGLKGDISILIYKKTDPFQKDWQNSITIPGISDLILKCVNINSTYKYRPTAQFITDFLNQIINKVQGNIQQQQIQNQILQENNQETNVQQNPNLGKLQQVFKFDQIINKAKNEPLKVIFYNNDKIITGDKFGFIKCFQKDSEQIVWEYKVESNKLAQIRGLKLDKQQQNLYVCGWNCPIFKFDAEKGKLLFQSNLDYQFRDLDISNCNQYIIAGGIDKQIYCFNTNQGKEIWKSQQLSYMINFLKYSSDDNFIYVGSEGEIACFKQQFNTYKIQWVSNNQIKNSIRSIIEDPVDQVLYASSVGYDKGQSGIYKLSSQNGDILDSTYNCKLKKKIHNQGFFYPVFDLFFINNNQNLLAVMGDIRLYVFNTTNLQLIQKSNSLSNLIQNRVKASLSQDQQQIAISCDIDRKVIILDL